MSQSHKEETKANINKIKSVTQSQQNKDHSDDSNIPFTDKNDAKHNKTSEEKRISKTDTYEQVHFTFISDINF